MMASEERRKILNLVAEGKITPEQGEELLSALGRSSPPTIPPAPSQGELAPPQNTLSSEKRILKLSVTTPEGDKVCLKLPLALASFALQFVPKKMLPIPSAEGAQEINLPNLLQSLTEVPDGQILKISSAEGKVVEITLE